MIPSGGLYPPQAYPAYIQQPPMAYGQPQMTFMSHPGAPMTTMQVPFQQGMMPQPFFHAPGPPVPTYTFQPMPMNGFMAGSQYPATSGGYMVASMPPGAAQTASFQKAAEDQEAHSHVFKQHEE